VAEDTRAPAGSNEAGVRLPAEIPVVGRLAVADIPVLAAAGIPLAGRSVAADTLGYSAGPALVDNQAVEAGPAVPVPERHPREREGLCLPSSKRVRPTILAFSGERERERSDLSWLGDSVRG
jgi:hypothetical protein